MKYRFSKFIWGIFLLLATIFVLANQFNGFINLGTGSIIAVVLALIFIVQCIAHLHFASLPIPLAVLYIVFKTHLGLPDIPIWTLILVAVLTTIGLGILLSGKHSHRYHRHWNNDKTDKNDSINDNNPSISVDFGGMSKRLYADNLETVQLSSHFGGLEIFFDQVRLSPGGAQAHVNCHFGAIKIFVPRQWKIIDRVNCSLGGIDIERPFIGQEENAPQLTLTGSVSFGGIEVRYI